MLSVLRQNLETEAFFSLLGFFSLVLILQEKFLVLAGTQSRKISKDTAVQPHAFDANFPSVWTN